MKNHLRELPLTRLSEEELDYGCKMISQREPCPRSSSHMTNTSKIIKYYCFNHSPIFPKSGIESLGENNASSLNRVSVMLRSASHPPLRNN